jgi:hypothetical protein
VVTLAAPCQRVVDKVDYAIEILRRYAPHRLAARR